MQGTLGSVDFDIRGKAMIKKDRGNEIDPGQSFEIDLFRPQDAEAVGHCFRSVYGEEYPVKTVYLPEKLIQENGLYIFENLKKK